MGPTGTSITNERFSSPRGDADLISCSWCGFGTRPSVACDVCGSPMRLKTGAAPAPRHDATPERVSMAEAPADVFVEDSSDRASCQWCGLPSSHGRICERCGSSVSSARGFSPRDAQIDVALAVRSSSQTRRATEPNATVVDSHPDGLIDLPVPARRARRRADPGSGRKVLRYLDVRWVLLQVEEGALRTDVRAIAP